MEPCRESGILVQAAYGKMTGKPLPSCARKKRYRVAALRQRVKNKVEPCISTLRYEQHIWGALLFHKKKERRSSNGKL